MVTLLTSFIRNIKSNQKTNLIYNIHKFWMLTRDRYNQLLAEMGAQSLSSTHDVTFKQMEFHCLID